MNTSLLTASPSANMMKWPVVRLSRKVVSDFQKHNILPAFTPQQRPIDNNMTGPKAATSKQMKTRNKNSRSDNQLDKFKTNDMKFDADIQGSGTMQPMIILDRIAEPQALTNDAEPSTSGKKKTTPAPKNAVKKPKKIGRPQFVLPQTRSKKI